MRYVYLINKEYTDEYKIGISNKPEKRLKGLQTGNSEQLIIYEKFPSEFATKVETRLHRQYGTTRKKGEWFELTEEQASGFLSLCEEYEKQFSFLNNNNVFFQKETEKLKKW